jgi:uncharacterized protein
MQKIILDTNILVSALISRSAPAQILYECVLEEIVTVCLSNNILDEYKEILVRDKFTKLAGFREKAAIVLSRIRKIGYMYEPIINVDVLRDADDNKFLELALASSADFLITGNTQDFMILSFGSTRIITPREYWDVHRPHKP